MIQTHLTSQIVGAIASKVGVSPSTAKTIVNSAMPLVLGMMTKKATSSEDNAKSLFKAIEKHDGTVYAKVEQDPEGLVNEGDRMLNHVFGEKKSVFEGLIAKATAGSDAKPEQAGQLIKAMSPLLMGALGQEQTKQHLDYAGMMKQVQAYGKQENEISNEEQNLLVSLLDQDGDGSVVDDMFGLAKKFMA